MKSFAGKSVSICINPGTGPIEGASLKSADENIYQLIDDVAGTDPGTIAILRTKEDDRGGRYGFRLQREGCSCDIRMPGLPCESVRYLGLEKQNIWDFPRLYVEGSSWVWKYAIDRVRDQLQIGWRSAGESP